MMHEFIYVLRVAVITQVTSSWLDFHYRPMRVARFFEKKRVMAGQKKKNRNDT